MGPSPYGDRINPASGGRYTGRTGHYHIVFGYSPLEEKNERGQHFTRQQGLDELVPSRYAVQVGDIEVLVISDGVLPITARTLATNADATEYGNWLDDMFLPQDVLDWPLNVVVVQRRPDDPRRRGAGCGVPRLPAGGSDGPPSGGRGYRSLGRH